MLIARLLEAHPSSAQSRRSQSPQIRTPQLLALDIQLTDTHLKHTHIHVDTLDSSRANYPRRLYAHYTLYTWLSGILRVDMYCTACSN